MASIPVPLISETDQANAFKTAGQAELDRVLANMKIQMERNRAISEADMKATMAAKQAELDRETAKMAMEAKLKDSARKAAAQNAQAEGQEEAVTGKFDRYTNLTNGPDTGSQFEIDPANISLPPVGQAPPFLVNQQQVTDVSPREVGPGWTVPMRSRRTVTNVSPNVLSQGERIRALQNNYRLQAEERRAQAERLQDIVSAEAEDLGGTIFSEQEGEIEEGSTKTRFNELVSKYGPVLATKIVAGARAHARSLELDRRKEKFKSRETEARSRRAEGRRTATAEAREAKKQARPTALADQKEAELLLKIGRGESLSKNERAFLDERQKSKPLDIAIRNAMVGIGGEPKVATDEIVAAKQEELGIDDPAELRSRLELMGYVFPRTK